MPKRYPPDDPREWLNRANSNLVRAKVTFDGVYLEDLCFDAQQAVEKAIKGVLMKHGVTFPYTHDITRLLTLLEGSGLNIPQYVRMGERLSQFAVVTRYPDMAPPISIKEYKEIIKIAEGVVQWAEDIILREMEEETKDEIQEEENQ